MRVKTEFQIYERTHRSGNKGWIVSLGMVQGKRKFKSFSTIEEAQQYKAQCEEKQALKTPNALSDLNELGCAAIRHALEKLKPFEATITEAVDFFIKYAKPPKGKITIQEAMDLFSKEKSKQRLSKIYLERTARCFFRQFREKMKNCLLNGVSPNDAHRYIYGNKKWNETSRNTHLRHLRALYSFAKHKGYVTINPFESVPFAKPRNGAVRAKVLSVEDAKKLLQFALDEGNKSACAAMALVLFCGVRVEEVERLTWNLIDLDSDQPSVDVEHAKNGRRRVNDIPANAVHWLKLCRSKGRIAPENYGKKMQRLRRRAKIDYKQNAARHSFASYHVAIHKPEAAQAR